MLKRINCSLMLKPFHGDECFGLGPNRLTQDDAEVGAWGAPLSEDVSVSNKIRF